MYKQIPNNVIERFKNKNELDDSSDIYSIFSLMQII